MNQHSKIIQMVETTHITIGQWSHIYIKISQRHIHEILSKARQPFHHSHSFSLGETEETMDSPLIQSIKDEFYINFSRKMYKISETMIRA